MPPEQAVGGLVTPKTDLYSLGAMLYKMIFWTPPLLGDDSPALIGHRIGTPPVARTWTDRRSKAIIAIHARPISWSGFFL